MAGTGEIFFFVVLLALIAIRGYYFYFDVKNLYGSYSNPYTRGINGKTGDKKELKCEVGVIHIDKDSRYVCNDDGSCDPFNSDGSINTSTTGSALSDLKKCEGKDKCSFTIPDKTSVCSGCSSSMLIANYSCQPKD